MHSPHWTHVRLRRAGPSEVGIVEGGPRGCARRPEEHPDRGQPERPGHAHVRGHRHMASSAGVMTGLPVAPSIRLACP